MNRVHNALLQPLRSRLRKMSVNTLMTARINMRNRVNTASTRRDGRLATSQRSRASLPSRSFLVGGIGRGRRASRQTSTFNTTVRSDALHRLIRRG